MDVRDPLYAYPDHDCWLHWDVTYRCNLECAYCFTLPHRKLLARLFRSHRINVPINIPVLMENLEWMGNTFLITFTGSGEPFLIDNLTEACVELTKKHYISVNTNLTIPQVRDFARTVDPGRVFFIHASFHYQQLRERRLLDAYMNHFSLCRERGFNIYGDAVAYPPLLAEVDNIRSTFLSFGNRIKFSPFAGTYNKKRYPDAYTTEERQGFGFTSGAFGAPDVEATRLCNAGYNVGAVHPSGKVTLCVLRKKRIGHVYRGIRFRNEMTRCSLKYCSSPLCDFDALLFRRALVETGATQKRRF